MDDLVDASGRDSDLNGETMLSQAQWCEELFLEDLAWMEGLVDCGHGMPLSVVVDDLHVLWTCVGPAEADSPLLVDSNAVLAFPISFQLLQTVVGWDLQIVQVLGGVEKQRLPVSRSLQLRTKQLGAFPCPNPFRLFVGEGSEHFLKYNVSRQ